MFVIVNNPYS